MPATAAPNAGRLAPLSLDAIPPAPRVPSKAAKEAVLGLPPGRSALLGVGVVSVVMGSVFALVFCWGLPVDMALDRGGREVQGRVLSAEVDTHTEINDKNPTELTVAYEVDGRELRATSSTTDEALIGQAPVGAEVPVEYDPARPDWARVKGTTHSTFGYGGGMTLLFPAIGLVLLLVGASALLDRRRQRAYASGTPAMARVTWAGQENPGDDEGPTVYRVDWRLEAPGGTFDGSLKTGERAVLTALFGEDFYLEPHAAPEALLRELRLPVLYLPEDPRVSVPYLP